MTYVMYHPKSDRTTLGQCWHDETVKGATLLCSRRTTNREIYKWCLGGEVLEAGCGIGNWVFHLGNRGIDILGIDLSDEAIAIAKEADPKVPIIRADAMKNDLEDGRFGTVLSFGVIEHFEFRTGNAILALRRVIAPSGVLVVTVPTQNLNRTLLVNPMKTLKRFLNKLRGVEYVFEEYRYTRREFSAMLELYGFGIVETMPDEYRLPYNVGLWVDYPILRAKEKWRLNWFGVLVAKMCHRISPWFANGMTMWVCVKK